MHDGIIAETGNSRYLRTVAGIKQLCPTYDSFLELLVKGEFPIDLAGRNPDGWAQQGTDLNKANLLTDATAALADLGPEATPNEMLAALANIIKAANTDAASAKTTANNALSKANSAQSSVSTLTTKVNGLIKSGTTDLTAGSSSLATGTVYLVYE